MKTLSKAVAVASLLSAGIMSAQVANAEVSYNAAVASDYVWRGQTQTDKGVAIQGGADFSHESGLSAGIWGSNVDFGTNDDIEYDLYAAYGFAASELDLSVGFISYNYDGDTDTAYEVNFGVAKDAFSALASIAVDTETDAGYTYLEGGYDMDLPQDLGLSLHAGYGIPEASGADSILDLAATVGKSLEMLDVAATITYIDADVEDDVLFFLTASKEF
jgi:uncharacterized protein (TIGR02001 family)